MAFYPTYPQTYPAYPQTISNYPQILPNPQGAAVPAYVAGIPPWGQQQTPLYSLSPPTGVYSSLTYIDPITGKTINLCVDNAYIQIIHDIISMQGIPSCHSVTVTYVPDGEFSLDEMSRAEDLIEEIGHAH